MFARQAALCSVLLLGCTALPVRGDDAVALARQARAVLSKHCYRCHGKDGAMEGGMNYVLDFRALVSRHKVIPGKPTRSRLFKRLTSRDNPMPPDEEKVRPTPNEVAVLRQWIEAGAPNENVIVARRLVTEADILRSIDRDLAALRAEQRPFARYFTLANLYNAQLSEDQLATYRHGLSKLLNSLSWAPTIAVPRVIDPRGTILRIDLRDYAWDAGLWQKIMGAYPYGLAPAHPLARAIRTTTGCALVQVRADWFVFAASRPPLYHDILRLPATEQELEKLLHLDVADDIAHGRVARAAFNSSGVSRNNRLIERHRTSHGAYWKSYDFAGNTDRRNLFAHPLGPGDDDDLFAHDGGEIIFNLPNGLQAYLLVNGKGNRLDEGPTRIVSVKNRANPTVINGVSCMFCHARGVIDKADQVRSHAEKNPGAFSGAQAAAIRSLYPPAADFRELLHQDAERFDRAMRATGTRPGSTEPVAALSDRFEAELDLTLAAAELGIETEALLRGLRNAPDVAQRLGSLRLPGGTVQRQVFVASFDALIHALGLGTTLHALDQIIARTSDVIRAHPSQALTFFERGNAFYDRGEPHRASADYTEAIRLDLRTTEVYLNRGMARALENAYEAALADYTEAIRLDPRNVEAYHNRALAHVHQGDDDAAIADFTAALRLQPRSALLLERRGDAYHRQGDQTRARADYQAALRRQPGLARLVRKKQALDGGKARRPN